MNLFSVVGIDPSLSNCSVVLLSSSGRHRESSFSSKPAGKSVLDRIERYECLAGRVSNMVFSRDVELIVLEGYSYGSKHSHETIYEFGALLRRMLIQRGTPVLEIPPSTLKSAVACTGRATKQQMIQAVRDRWNVDFGKHHDGADAYSCAQVAMAIVTGDWWDHQAAESCSRQTREFYAMQDTGLLYKQSTQSQLLF